MTNEKVEIIYMALLKMDKSVFPAKTAFAIVRNIHMLQPIVEDYRDAKLKVLQKYNGKSEYLEEDNQSIFIFESQEIRNKVAKEFDELDKIDNHIRLYKIKESELESLGNISISIAEGLLYMLEED